MSLIVQASRKANEYSLTHKENKMFNRSIEALRLNVAPSTTSGGGDSSGTPSHLHPHHHHLKIPGSGSNTMSCSTPIIDNKSEICVEPNHNRNTHETPNRSYSYRIFTKLIKMAFSTVGLIGVVFLYSTLGALMFQLLEQHEELRLCEEGKGKFVKEVKQCREKILLYVIYNSTNAHPSLANQTRQVRSASDPPLDLSVPPAADDFITANYSLESFWATTSQPPISHPSIDNNEQYPYINLLLIEFRRKVIEIQANTSYYGQDCVRDSKWSLFSSLLFTITTISTVGYGFIAPLTWEGRVVCVCYASMGIPIFLMCLTNLSSALGKVFKYIYAKFDSVNPIGKLLKRRRRERRSTRRAKKRKALVSSQKDNNPKNLMVIHDGQSIVTKSDLSSNMVAATAVAGGRERDLEEFNLAYELNLADEDEYLSEDDDDEDDDEYFYETMEGEVPVSLAIFVIVLYMTTGAWLFHKFEGWTFTQSFYFVFVTLTTMGFGDLVPGQKPKDKFSNIKKLTVCFYSLFGMAIIGMCLNVMQYIARRKIMWLFGRLKQLSSCCAKKRKPTDGKTGDGIKDASQLTEALIQKEKEKEAIMNRLKLLQQYENAINAKRRRRHVLS